MYKAQKMGLEASRIDLSGASEEKGDIIIERKKYECKYRSSGLKTLYGWFAKAKEENCEALIVKTKEAPCLVVIGIGDYLNLLLEKKQCQKKNTG